ncbi:pentapeptide MXKDX repeat protein [Rhodopseudomonas sp. BR0G17]|uniref:pentapeptide MXKDX repeat protein n=1 Tax=Rhodopseudomonas sp. BR0G17 TaxID=2269368 RepID=UPI0013DF8970|nr:pentapeptide MXKDX repeat protein [Rhodopseudomonas sp. BR0G17]NEW95470.1 pentapeptide MXKDX repeat protein [Rhodopseudomonas sp. BR0G17]
MTRTRIALALMVAAFSSSLAMAPAAYAMDKMEKKDGMAHDSMAKDSMSKDGMKKDTMAKDGMKKDAMSKDGMSKDQMKK